MNMKQVALSLMTVSFTATFSLPAMGSSFDWSAFGKHKFEVKKIDEETLAIRGSIGDGDYQKFKAAFGSKIKSVRISGPGGSVIEAAKMGADLQERGVDVVVDGPCLSSCANYLFLAGNRKTFKNEGLVAFHGSPWIGNILSKDPTS